MPGSHSFRHIRHASTTEVGPGDDVNRPGEFLASYRDNTSGRGTHRNCIAALSTMQKIGPVYGIKLGTTKVLLGSSGGREGSIV
jgi:hypothetical protein